MSENRTIIFIICAWLAVLFTGMTSELYLGDESYHYRYAKQYIETGRRPVFDAAYGSPLPPGYFFSSEPLWPFVLSLFWRLAGRVSFVIAQVYHSLYYLLLLIFTYLAARRRCGDERQAGYAVLLVATMPMMAVFGTIFYLDLPMAGLAVMSVTLIARKNFWGAGLALAAACLMKRSGFFFLPGVAAVVLLMQDASRMRRVAGIATILAVVAGAVYADMSWRQEAFRKFAALLQGPESFSQGGVANRFAFSMAGLAANWRGSVIGKTADMPSLINPVDFLRYAGIVFAVCLVAWFRAMRPRENLLFLLPAASYVACFLYFFGPFADIRYLLPVFPLIAIPVSAVLSNRARRFWRVAAVALCCAQLIGALGYLHAKRRMPRDVRDAFVFLSNNSSTDSSVLYPGQILLEATGRRVVWSRFGNLPGVFYITGAASLLNEFDRMGLDYVVTDRRYIINDPTSSSVAGYPGTFISRLETYPFMTRVYENPTVSIWKINRGVSVP